VRIALIGATGLIGAMLAERLVGAGHDLHRLQRRPGGGSGEAHVANPAAWPELVSQLRPEVAISALGSTIKQAGSRAAFRAVDHDMVLAFARAARAAGAMRMITISSVGADPQARAFYLRTKGEIDAALADLGFARLDIFRPGLLRGARREHRLGERIANAVSPLVGLALRGSLDRFAAIDADKVAAAAANVLALDGTGTHIHHNREIRRLAGV